MESLRHKIVILRLTDLLPGIESRGVFHKFKDLKTVSLFFVILWIQSFRFTPIFGFMYLLVNAVYITVFNGKNFDNFDYIYPILDWKNGLGVAIGVSFGSMPAIILLSLCFYALSNFRDYIWRTIYLREDLQEVIVSGG